MSHFPTGGPSSATRLVNHLVRQAAVDQSVGRDLRREHEVRLCLVCRVRDNVRNFVATIYRLSLESRRDTRVPHLSEVEWRWRIGGVECMSLRLCKYFTSNCSLSLVCLVEIY